MCVCICGPRDCFSIFEAIFVFFVRVVPTAIKCRTKSVIVLVKRMRTFALASKRGIRIDDDDGGGVSDSGGGGGLMRKYYACLLCERCF